MSDSTPMQDLDLPPGWEIYAISFADSPYAEWAKIREATPPSNRLNAAPLFCARVQSQ